MEFKRIVEAQHGLAAATPIFLDAALLLIDCATNFLPIRGA
jgi:phage tail protein X